MNQSQSAASGIRVLDCHAHFPLASPRRKANTIIEQYEAQRDHRMRLEWDFPARDEPPGTPEEIEETMRLWKAEVDKYDLDRVVFVTGGGNEQLARVIGMHPDRFLGFSHHHFETEDALGELERAHQELGLRGIKLLAPRFSRRFEDEEFRPLWEYAAEHRLPVLIHFGLLGKAGGVAYHPLINPLTLFPTASKYPEIPFIVPHFGCGYVRELLHLCWSCPNVYVDTSGSNQWALWEPSPLGLDDLFRRFYETVGPERIIFGTDSSWFPRGFVYRYLQDQLRTCRQLAFKEEDIAQIFGGNARRLLGLPEETATQA